MRHKTLSGSSAYDFSIISTRVVSWSALVFASLIFGLGTDLLGQAPRVTQPVDESRLVELKGDLHPLARGEFDRGQVASSTVLTHMQLVLKRSATQEAALDTYLAGVQQPGSPNYHKWLTPEEFGRLYGTADTDVQKLTSWLESYGLTITTVSKARTLIDFSGTVAQASNAFHVEIHSFNVTGRQFDANTTDPKIPAAFAPVVSGIANLNTDHPKPLNVPGKGGQYDPSLRRFVPGGVGASASGLQLRPNYTTSGPPPQFYVTPADAATIYDTPNQVLNTNFTGSSSYDGTGVTIGIAGQSNIDPSIVSSYRKLFLRDPKDITKVLAVSDSNNLGVVSGQSGEVYLDTEVSGGLAPGASIHLYVATGVGAAAQQALEENTVDILSVSYGTCELMEGNAGNQLFNTLWKQAAAQGITVFVATGDEGSAACDSNTNPVAVKGLSVNGLASTPYNIAVGGTDYYDLPNNFGTYVSPDDSQYYGSARSYISESTWNDSTQINKNAVLAQNVPWPLPAVASQLKQANLLAGSGGASGCRVLDLQGECAGYPKPTWQTGAGVPNDGVRDLPDVSLLAGDGLYSATWLVCDDSLASDGKTMQNCSPQSLGNSPFSFGSSGGTSASTPAFAGIFALIVQKTGQRQGQAAATLYNLANGNNGQKIFHDVIVGNIAVPCYQGTDKCTLNSAGNYYLSGYDTAAGYDLATGLGSVDAAQLVANWPAPGTSPTLPTATTVPTVTVTLPSAVITPADLVTLRATVAGPSDLPAPTGSVTFSIDSASLTAAGEGPLGTATLNSGSASFTVPVNTLNAGAGNITATYTPDAASTTIYFRGVGTAPLAVLPGTFSISGAPVALSVGTSGTSTITVSAIKGFATADTVSLSCTLTGMPPNANSGYYPSCQLSVSSITVSKATQGTVTATFVAPTTAAVASSREGLSPFGSLWLNAGGATLAGAVLLVFPRRRTWKPLCIFLVALAILSSNGCGGSNHNRTTAGIYSFTIVGTLANFPASPQVVSGIVVTVK